MGKYSEFINTAAIKAAREEKKLTLQQMAEVLGCSTGTMHNIEAANKKPDIEQIAIICYILEKDVTQLFNLPRG